MILQCPHWAVEIISRSKDTITSSDPCGLSPWEVKTDDLLPINKAGGEAGITSDIVIVGE